MTEKARDDAELIIPDPIAGDAAQREGALLIDPDLDAPPSQPHPFSVTTLPARARPALKTRWRNPVFAKEVRIRLRGRRAFVLQMLFLGLVFLPFMVWLSMGTVSLGTVNTFLFDRDPTGLYWLCSLVALEAVLVCLLAILYGAVNFTVERESGTFELLVTTPQSARAIVFGKYLGSQFYVGMVLISGLPALILCLFFGGVSYGDILYLSGLLVLLALTWGMIATYCSLWMRRTISSVLMALLTCAVVSLAPLALNLTAWGLCLGLRSSSLHHLTPLFDMSPTTPGAVGAAVGSISAFAGVANLMLPQWDVAARYQDALGGAPVDAVFAGYWGLVLVLFFLLTVGMLKKRAVGA